MASTYSTNLRLELIGAGDQAGTWGTTTNTNLGTLIEGAVAGYSSVSVTTANQALTASNGAADQSRMAMLNLTTTTGANFNVYVPPATKKYTIKNASAYTATVYNSTILGNTTAAGTGVAIPAGAVVSLYSDGTNCASAISYIPSLTLGSALPLASGGTGATTSAAAPWALKGANSDITSISGLTTALTAAQGGTGVLGTLTGVLYGNGTGAHTVATAAQIASTIGTTNVTNATNVTGTIGAAVTGTTQTVSDNSTLIATTAFVQSAVSTNVPAASTSTAGKVALATNAEAQAGTDATKAITAAAMAAASLGRGQTWQAVTRSAGTNYTNATGKPIEFSMLGYSNGAGGGYVYMVIDGVVVPFANWYAAGGSYPFGGTIMIPVGSVYAWNWSVSSGSPTLSGTWELR